MKNGLSIFTRSFEADKSLSGESLAIAPGAFGQTGVKEFGGVDLLVRKASDGVIALAVKGNAVAVDGGVNGLAIKVSNGKKKLRFKVYVWKGNEDELPEFAEIVKSDGNLENLAALTEGGPRRWVEDLETQGKLGEGKGPTSSTRLRHPFENPWKSILHFGGHDFFSNGDVAICTMEGDVWLVKGVDEKLEKLTWQRIATGLYHPLGLRIVDDQIYVAGRDQITRLKDLNGDGETDFYENFNNEGQVSLGSHEFVTALETDPEGNFYYIKCSNGTEHGGSILKVHKSGQGIERVATGFRNPNGFCWLKWSHYCSRPTGGAGFHLPASILSNQEGSTVSCPCTTERRHPRLMMAPSLGFAWWINSCGGQAWVEGKRWGPLGENFSICPTVAVKCFTYFEKR